ncbi:diguanylate cyclase (GGDEF)-like protein [Bacillus sp. SORGH_AS 510]|nr:diguanylate cyclase (GGDEF)-like protein [Bacillus sp. SORGH_AS_0510]
MVLSFLKRKTNLRVNVIAIFQEGKETIMLKARLYDISIFLIALAIAISSKHLLIPTSAFFKALILFWVFSSLYYHLRVFSKNGNTNFEYGISYCFSFVLVFGPFGLFIFETFYRFTVYAYRKWTKTADPSEFTDTLYNIGAFVITNSVAYFLYLQLNSSFDKIPYGFWILMFLLTCIASLLSGTFLVTAFYIMGDLKTLKEGVDFIFKSRSLLDYGKVAITNGLLFLFLIDREWDMLISLFILNYVVSRSFFSKAQSAQHKLERDKFEQMAYTDFLTGVYNRTFMDKKMAELNQTEEQIGIVVCDIDKFKRINDNYNHAVGDKVIQHFASTLKSYLDEDDYLFRSGGEEFTLCLRKRDYDQTRNLVNEILKGVENNAVNVEYQGEHVSISYTASFGLYYYKVNDQISIEKAYIMADQLLFRSKDLGKNRASMVNALSKTAVV